MGESAIGHSRSVGPNGDDRIGDDREAGPASGSASGSASAAAPAASDHPGKGGGSPSTFEIRLNEPDERHPPPLAKPPLKPGLQPYARPQPWGMAPDMMLPGVITDDERLWAPVGPGVWSRPIHLNVTGGFYVHLLRVRRSGILQRHRHSGQVHALVLRGSWYYLEHDWVAAENSYVFEPPGETHTLVVPDDCSEMITLFTVHGALMYVDPEGKSIGYDDVFTRIDAYRVHFDSVGLGADHVRRFMR